MSVMLIDDSTFNSIYRTLLNPDFSGNGGKYCLYTSVYHMNSEQIEKLVRQMRILNIKSYRDRYKSERFYYGGKVKIKLGKLLNPFQLLKSMEALLYNSDYKKHDCLEQFENIIDELRKQIINNLPEYNNAVWG